MTIDVTGFLQNLPDATDFEPRDLTETSGLSRRGMARTGLDLGGSDTCWYRKSGEYPLIGC
jgi:hypothetical protein